MSRVIECPYCHGHKTAQGDGDSPCELCQGFGEITDKTPGPTIKSFWATSHDGLVHLTRPYIARGWTQVDVWTLRGEWWALLEQPHDIEA